MRYHSTNKTVYSAKYHIIFCPKYRKRLLQRGVDERLKVIVEEILAGHHVELLEIEVMPDHLHLLVEVPPSLPLSRLIQVLKGRSSRILRSEFPRLQPLPALWSPSWFVSTVGGAPLEVVKQYVANQKAVA